MSSRPRKYVCVSAISGLLCLSACSNTCLEKGPSRFDVSFANSNALPASGHLPMSVHDDGSLTIGMDEVSDAFLAEYFKSAPAEEPGLQYYVVMLHVDNESQTSISRLSEAVRRVKSAFDLDGRSGLKCKVIVDTREFGYGSRDVPPSIRQAAANSGKASQAGVPLAIPTLVGISPAKASALLYVLPATPPTEEDLIELDYLWKRLFLMPDHAQVVEWDRVRRMVEEQDPNALPMSIHVFFSPDENGSIRSDEIRQTAMDCQSLQEWSLREKHRQLKVEFEFLPSKQAEVQEKHAR